MSTEATGYHSTACVLCLAPRSVKGLWVRCNLLPQQNISGQLFIGAKILLHLDDRTQPQSRFDYKPVQAASITHLLRAMHTSLLPSSTAKVVDEQGSRWAHFESGQPSHCISSRSRCQTCFRRSPRKDKLSSSCEVLWRLVSLWSRSCSSLMVELAPEVGQQ